MCLKGLKLCLLYKLKLKFILRILINYKILSVFFNIKKEKKFSNHDIIFIKYVLIYIIIK